MKKGTAPSPDGFTIDFFTLNWDIVGEEALKAVKSYFSPNHLYGLVNSTIITLVPKLEKSATMKDFRRIAYCNILYKYFSKILIERIKGVFPSLIYKKQNVFITGRAIRYNILLMPQLIKNI